MLFCFVAVTIIIACRSVNQEVFCKDSSAIICPKCKSDSVAKILYGLIDLDNADNDFKEKVRNKEIVLGGCVVGPESHHCKNCKYDW